MKIAIRGAGSVGGTLARMWAAKDHDVTLGVRHPNDAKVQSVVAATGGRARAASVPDAASDADVVVLATPWEATEAAIRAAGNFHGKVVVDATNPLKPDLSGLSLGHSTSAGEQVAGWATGARVVKAFNAIGAAHMADPRFGALRASMLICGDDGAAKAPVQQLAGELGFDPVDCGPLPRARLLEPPAILWISLALVHGAGPNIGFALLRK